MSNNKIMEYINKVKDLMSEIEDTQLEVMTRAAEAITDCLARDGIVHVFGSGHAQVFVQELFYRAGGLAPVNGLLEQPLSIYDKATKSTWFERQPGYGKLVFEKSGMTENDLLIIVSHSGRINVAIELAIAAKESGIKVIALTSAKHSDSFTSLHKSGLLLKDIADIVIDDCAPASDAIIEIEDLNLKVAAVTTVTGCTILQSIVAQVVQNLSKRGINPPVWMSANLDGGDEVNTEHIKKYGSRIRNL